jgi:hypothetical protein
MIPLTVMDMSLKMDEPTHTDREGDTALEDDEEEEGRRRGAVEEEEEEGEMTGREHT